MVVAPGVVKASRHTVGSPSRGWLSVTVLPPGKV
jgi:hypothetical protein